MKNNELTNVLQYICELLETIPLRFACLLKLACCSSFNNLLIDLLALVYKKCYF